MLQRTLVPSSFYLLLSCCLFCIRSIYLIISFNTPSAWISSSTRLEHSLFRSASHIPTSRSYPRHLVKFPEKKKENRLSPFCWVFFLSCFLIISSIFSLESFPKSSPGSLHFPHSNNLVS